MPFRTLLATVAGSAILFAAGGCSLGEDGGASRVTVALAGDVLVHTGVWETAEEDARTSGLDEPTFTPMFSGAEPLIASADLAVCHLETPVAEDGGPYRNYPRFSAPPSVIDGLADTGFDVCTTASNHSVDRGFTGLRRTIRALDRRGMEHTGTYAKRKGAGQPLVVEVQGVRIGIISMTYGTNGLRVDKPWSVNLIDVPRAVAQAKEMRADGVDIVMVAIHAGDEYDHAPNVQQSAVFDELTASPDIDFVYGHHAHVVQPFERLNGTWVLYGLGNFVAQQKLGRPDTYQGLVATMTFTKTEGGRYRAVEPTYSPILITHPDRDGTTRVLEAARVADDPGATDALRERARRAVRAVDHVMRRDGVRSTTSSEPGP